MDDRLLRFADAGCRDIGRNISNNADLRQIFDKPLWLAGRVREQRQRQRGPKVYSLHAPEVE